MLRTNPVSRCAGRKGWLFFLHFFSPLQSHNCSLQGVKRWGEGRWGRGASRRIYSWERQGCFKSKASAIVTESFHFMNKRLTAYSDSLVLILSARAPLPFTNQRQNVIPASKMQRPEGQGLCAPTKILATLTDILKKRERGGGGVIKTLCSSFTFSRNHFDTFWGCTNVFFGSPSPSYKSNGNRIRVVLKLLQVLMDQFSICA